jgi:FkbM family methyltransferase
LAFEANPYVYERFAPELLTTEIGVDYRLAAISDHAGAAELRIPIKVSDIAFDRANRISGLRHRTRPGFEYESITTPVLTIDAVLASGTNERAVAWIDAEGSQREILDGGPEFF